MADDAELREYVRLQVGLEHGLTEAQARRLKGATLAELRADAQEMRLELGLEPIGEGAARRDDRGRFASAAAGGVDMNRIIRAASGR